MAQKRISVIYLQDFVVSEEYFTLAESMITSG
jgi:hypothetical protein